MLTILILQDTIDYLSADFIGNHSNSTGGAIYNIGEIGDITGDFIGNYATSTNNSAGGGAIYNTYSGATIGNITGNFIGNYALGNSSVSGGAIYNSKATMR